MAFTGTVLSFENGTVVGRGGTVVPPSTFKVGTHDVDLDSSRSQSGYATRNRVRGGASAAREVNVSWDRISWQQLVVLIAAGNDAKFTLSFIDPASVGGMYTGSFYRDADMTYEMKNIVSESEAYWTTNMTFVEF